MRTALLLIPAVMTAACFSDSAPGQPDPIDPEGAHHTYIVDSITLPVTSADATTHSLDLDGDGKPENKIGQILAIVMSLGDYGQEVNTTIAERITAGELIHLFDVQARSLTNAERVGWYPFLGADPDGDASDNWPGPESYTAPVPGEPGAGDIIDSVLTAGGGRLPLALVLPNTNETIVFKLRAAAIDADISAGTLDGVIAGAVVGDDIDRVLLPALQLGLQAAVDDSCGTTDPCPSGSLGSMILNQFDDNNDGIVSVDELRGDSLVNSLLTPDLDLLDSGGNYNPGYDGVNDSLSFAVRFTAVPADFPVPGAAQ